LFKLDALDLKQILADCDYPRERIAVKKFSRSVLAAPSTRKTATTPNSFLLKRTAACISKSKKSSPTKIAGLTRA